MDNQRSFNVKKLDGTIIPMAFPAGTKVIDIRPTIKDKAGIDEDRQRLIYKAKILADDMIIGEVLPEDGLTIHLMQKAAGAGSASSQPQPQPSVRSNPSVASTQITGPDGNPIGVGIQIGAFPNPPSQGGNGAAQPNMPPMPNFANFANLLIPPPPQEGAQGSGGQQQAHPPPPSFNEIMGSLNGLLGGGAGNQGAAGAEGGPPPLNNMLNGLMNNLNSSLQNLQNQTAQRQAQQPTSQPARPSPAATAQPTAAPQRATVGGGAQIELPHQVLLKIGNSVNSMYGPAATFPGPLMPQLQVQRNFIVLLGSYLVNLNFQLQRLSPLFQRTGDLLQRENQLAGEAERKLTEEMANQLGVALEDISRATGSVAHLFKSLKMGTNASNSSVAHNSYQMMFKPIVEDTGVVKVPAFSTATTASQPPTSTTTTPTQQPSEERKESVDPFSKLSGIIQKEDYVKFMMKKTDELNHLPPKFHESCVSLKQHFGSSTQLAIALAAKIKTFLSTEKMANNLTKAIDVLGVGEKILAKYAEQAINKLLAAPKDQTFQQFIDMSKGVFHLFIEEFVASLTSGFKNGQEGVWTFIQTNLSDYNLSQTPPNMQMIANMKTQQTFKMIKDAYDAYQASKKPKEDVEMKDEAPKQAPAMPKGMPTGMPGAMPGAMPGMPRAQPAAQGTPAMPGAPQQQQQQEQVSPETMAARKKFFEKYKTVFIADQAAIKEKDPQNPLSLAYKSTCSFSSGKQAPAAGDQQQQDYFIDRQTKLNQLSASDVVKDMIRKNLITGGGFPQAKVEEIMKKMDGVPADLVQAFLEMEKQAIRFRLSEDEDFQEIKAEQTTRFPNLRKFE